MRFALIAVVLAGQCAAAPALTTIQDTLFKADGTLFTGIAQIEWKSFQAADGSQIPEQTITIQISSGRLRVGLVPTRNALSPASYTVTFNSNGRTQFVEYWSVPASSTAVRLKDVRLQGQAGGISDDAGTIDGVAGLRSELNIRPVKGSGYLASRAAVINASGALDAALGDPGDCIHVDGTSGPCGSAGGSGPIFMDSETPAGAINGTNASFTLAAAPATSASVNLYLNGLLMRQGLGYTISGTSITMLPGSIPGPGDVLQAWYRLPSTGPQTIQFREDETPAGNVDGSNAVFTLQAAPMPALSLQMYRNGVLLKAGLDYTLIQNTVTFVPAAKPYPGDVLQASYRH